MKTFINTVNTSLNNVSVFVLKPTKKTDRVKKVVSVIELPKTFYKREHELNLFDRFV
jgi:hypothetical protein